MEPPEPLRVAIVDEFGETDASPDDLELALRTAMAGGRGEVALLLTDSDAVRDLNRRFRGLDESTDVLTFPSGVDQGGDVAISVPEARRQAALRGVPARDETLFLAIHGGLHLMGLDDETEPERAAMVDRMNDVARAIGLPPDEAWASLLHEEASR